MIRPMHSLASPNHAHAWLQSGLDADIFAKTLLGVDDDLDLGLVSCALVATATEAANPEIGLWVDELARHGIPTVVSWTPQHCSVAVINPKGPPRGPCEIGPTSRYLGYAEFVFDHRCCLRKVGYEFAYSAAPPRALDRSKDANSMPEFLKSAAAELLIPGVSEFKRAMAMARQRESQLKHTALHGVLERSVDHAFAFIASSGLPVPDALKPAMEAYRMMTGERRLAPPARPTLSFQSREKELEA